MLEGHAITGGQAFRQFGIYRLSSIIHGWRKKGFDIDTKMIKGPDSNFAEYTIRHVPRV